VNSSEWILFYPPSWSVIVVRIGCRFLVKVGYLCSIGLLCSAIGLLHLDQALIPQSRDVYFGLAVLGALGLAMLGPFASDEGA
jgi:hypothetical protein